MLGSAGIKRNTLRSLIVLLADSETTMFVSDCYINIRMSVAALIYLFEYTNMWNEYSNPNLAFLLALLILGIPFKPEKIMKYPN